MPEFYGVGYPKTGNTWIRILLGRYIQLTCNLAEMPLFDPKEMADLKRQGYNSLTGEFTHMPLTWLNQEANDLTCDSVIGPFTDHKIVFMTRNPLDTLVSSFMHAKYKSMRPFKGNIADFIQDPVYGLTKLLRFHQIWAESRSETRSFFLLRYEDTHSDPAAQLRQLLAFLDQQIDDAAIQEAVSFASFENLKKLELSNTRLIYKSSGFNAFGDGPKDVPNAFHIRKGEVGGYRDELPEEMILSLEKQVKLGMPAFFGYS